MSSRLLAVLVVVAGCAHAATPDAIDTPDTRPVATTLGDPDRDPPDDDAPRATSTEPPTPPAVVFTNRGFSDAPDDPDAPRSILYDLPSTRDDDVARMTAVHARMPAIHACLRASLAQQSVDASLHARIVTDDDALAIASSPHTPALDACLLHALSGLDVAGHRGLVASVAIEPPHFAHVLRVADASARPIGDAGLCFWFESATCGPTDDCLPDGFRPGICPAAAPASLRFVFGAGEDRRPLRHVERIGADGRVSYASALPIALELEHGLPTLVLADADTSPRLTRTPIASNGAVVAIVGGGGTVVIRAVDGDVRFSEAESPDETLGFDDASGRITVGRKTCGFADARMGRIALACGERLVVVRGGRNALVFDADGTLLARADLAPASTGRAGLFPHVDARVETVRIEFDGRIYVH